MNKSNERFYLLVEGKLYLFMCLLSSVFTSENWWQLQIVQEPIPRCKSVLLAFQWQRLRRALLETSLSFLSVPSWNCFALALFLSLHITEYGGGEVPWDAIRIVSWQLVKLLKRNVGFFQSAQMIVQEFMVSHTLQCLFTQMFDEHTSSPHPLLGVLLLLLLLHYNNDERFYLWCRWEKSCFKILELFQLQFPYGQKWCVDGSVYRILYWRR